MPQTLAQLGFEKGAIHLRIDPLDDLQRQALPRLTISRAGHVDAGEVTQLIAGTIAAANLMREHMNRLSRVELALAPLMAHLMTQLENRLCAEATGNIGADF